jgi:phage tail sheath protein FI
MAEMGLLNEDKKNVAFIIGDTPARLVPDGTSIQTWATNAANASYSGDLGLTYNGDPYAAIYYPWGLATNLDGSYVFVPPSHMALRTYAYNDQVAYPWFAPAGFNRGIVIGINSVGYLLADGTYQPVTLNQGQRDVLYTNKINPIAYIPNRGLVVYGQKTLSAISNGMDRVNVSRLVCYLNYNLSNIAQPFLFEQNDVQTWKAVTSVFTSFLGNLFGLRALYDFAVACDSSTNTPTTIDLNQLFIDVAIKPEKSIEFIYIPLRLLNTGDPLPNAVVNPN